MGGDELARRAESTARRLPWVHRTCAPRPRADRRRGRARRRGSCRRVCTASVWNRAPAARATAASSAMGCTVPTSLLACITETSAVSRRTSAASAGGSTMPRPSTGSHDTVHPCASSALAVLSTASCSIVLTTRWRLPCTAGASSAPRMARLSDSVPPLVNTTSAAAAPSRAATCARASSSAALACWPSRWTLEGLPKTSTDARRRASATPGASGAVAL